MLRLFTTVSLSLLLLGCGSTSRREGVSGDRATPADQTAGRPEFDSSAVRAEVLRLERQYLASGVHGAPAGEALVAEDAIIHNPDGTVQTGAQMMADTKSGKMVIDTLRADTVDVRVLDPEVALAHGVAHLRGRLTDGGKKQDISGEYRFMDLWQRAGGQWRLVAEHATAMPH